MSRHGGQRRPALRIDCRPALTLALASVFFAGAARAQDAPFRIDADAAAVPRGVLRVGVSADFSYVDELRLAGGGRAPLGRRLGFDSTTDNVVASATVAMTRLPVSLEYGVTRWLSIGVSAPLVRRRVEVSADTNFQLVRTPPRTRLTDPSALSSFTHTNVGDIDATARVRLFDTFASKAPLRLRLAAEGGMRIGTGPSRRANNMIDPAASDGQNDVLASLFADLALGGRWSVSFAGSRTWQRPDRQTVVAADTVYPSRQVRGSVARDLGDLSALMIAPRYRLTRYLQLAASASRLAKTADRYDGAPPADGWGLVAPPVAAFNATRVGLGLVFATTPNGHSIGPWPVDLVFEHSRIVQSGGATIPDPRVDRIGGRVYMKLF